MIHPKKSNVVSVSIKLIVLTFATAAFFSCKNKVEKVDDTKLEAPIEEIVTAPSLEKGCYRYNENGNMVSFEITNSNNPVEGNLTYAFAEKDKNTGIFKGEFKDDKLVGVYTFQSEGKESNRQVAFMFKDNQLVEGYGELNEDGTKFKDVNMVNYSSAMPLIKANCE